MINSYAFVSCAGSEPVRVPYISSFCRWGTRCSFVHASAERYWGCKCQCANHTSVSNITRGKSKIPDVVFGESVLTGEMWSLMEQS